MSTGFEKFQFSDPPPVRRNGKVSKLDVMLDMRDGPGTSRNLTPEELEIINRHGLDEGCRILNEKPPITLQPVSRLMSDIEPRKVEWLWPGRIALGKLTLIAGDPGLGKSFLSLDLAARVSNGVRWPDCDSNAPQGSTIILSAEDDMEDTVRPRLDAAGASLHRIRTLEAICGRDDAGGYERPPDLQRDLAAIEQLLDQMTDTRLVVIDPLSGYLGKVDSHTDSEIRRVLSPVAKLAALRRIALVGLMHLRKAEGQASHRVMGSLAFVAAARAVWGVVLDKQDPERRLIVPIKNNLAKNTGGLAYTLSLRHSEADQPCVVWDASPVMDTADDLLGVQRHQPAVRDDAIDFLEAALSSGPRYSKDVEEEAREAHDIAPRTLKRAKKQLGVVAYRQTIPGPWLLKLPDQECQP